MNNNLNNLVNKSKSITPYNKNIIKSEDYVKAEKVLTNITEIGAWKVSASGIPLTDSYDLVAEQINRITGKVISPKYSLIKSTSGPTGPTGVAGANGNDGNIEPSSSNQIDLGASQYKFNNLYFNRTLYQKNVPFIIDENYIWNNVNNQTYNWTSIALSNNGNIQLASTESNGVYLSGNTGTIWNQISNSSLPITNNYTSVALSSDGSIQLAAKDSNGVYLSGNTGSSWNQISNSSLPITNNYTSVALSSDGSIQLAATLGNGVYISDDSGTTWSLINSIPISNNYSSVALSSNGKYQLVCTNNYDLNNNVYSSIDYGVTWSPFLNQYYFFTCVYMSGNGKIQVAIPEVEGIYISYDYGSSWSQISYLTQPLMNANFSSGSCSSDGLYHFLAGNESENPIPIIMSLDSGQTWEATGPSSLWTSVSVSGNGQIVGIEQEIGSIYNGLSAFSINIGITGSSGIVKEWFFNGDNPVNLGTSTKPLGTLYTSNINTGSTGFYVDNINVSSIVGDTGGLRYNTTSNQITYDSSKSFIIDHPDYSNKYLVHGCLEGPEAGVYYRGQGEITNNKYVLINLPNYVKNLATNFSIQITPIEEFDLEDEKEEQIIKYYSVSKVKNNSFKVYGKNGFFYWHVYGQRFSIEIEPNKCDVNVAGDGPYKYIVK